MTLTFLNKKTVSKVLITFLFFLPLLMLFFLQEPLAHESWVLTPGEIEEWDAKPKPEIFTTFNPLNIFLYTFTAAFLVGWILLNYTGARELFPDLQVRLASYGGYASLALRIALFVMLGMGAFGLGPRHGTQLGETPTLAAPDLELRLLEGNWFWLAGIEGTLAFLFLLGIYVRGAAAILLGLGVIGLFVFGYDMVAYIGLVGGAAVYLMLQGPGSYYIPMPPIPGTAKISNFLASQPRGRAQWLLRILAGLNLAYLGIEYKFLHPNQMLGIIELHHVPTFGLEHATFVFFMALVETLAGLLILAGVLMRPLSVVLFFAFVFFSAVLGESVFAHIIFYGLLVSFITNSAGRWRRPEATDKPGKVVIVGGSFAGVHAALRLQRLVGEFSNVQVTLIHRESYFLFHPMLPEVVGGSVQPGNIVNPIRRFCPKIRFIQGETTSIDHQAKKVHINLVSNETLHIDYDQLLVAQDMEANFSGVPGLLEHAFPIMTIGDALFLRQRVLECLEQAETISDPQRRKALLTFSVVGGGLRGCATASAMSELIQSALVSYPGVKTDEPKILLFEKENQVIPRYDSPLGTSAHFRLKKMGIDIFTMTNITAVTPEEVVLSGGDRIPTKTVVGTLVSRPKVISSLPGARPDGRLPVNPFLKIQGPDHIWAAGDCAGLSEMGPFMALREIRMGRRAAYNAYAATQGFKPLQWKEGKPLVYMAALGRKAAVGRFFGIPLGGIPAWLASRFLCLFTLPGLERNLRILIDWALDIPFRNDIVVLAPNRTLKLSSAHYEVGDEIVRQGDRGDCAYILQTGEAEVLKQVNGKWEKLANLNRGDCFGEIALLCDMPRTATVKCLTPVDVTVLPREQFMTLAEGYRDLGAALKARVVGRLSDSEQIGA
ncbi:MAG TPA: FAD-dependent oxidoreductase [Nitrospiria bacterium]